MDFDQSLFDKTALSNLKDNSRTKEAILDAISRRNTKEEEGGSDWEIYRDTIRDAYQTLVPIDKAEPNSQDYQPTHNFNPEPNFTEQYSELYDGTQDTEVGEELTKSQLQTVMTIYGFDTFLLAVVAMLLIYVLLRYRK